MPRFLKKRIETGDTAPGSIVFSGNKKMDKPVVSLFDYDKDSLKEISTADIEEALKVSDSKHVTWININGIHDTDLITRVGVWFNLHPLLLEDILFTGQQPKVEEYDNCLFVVMNLLTLDEKQPRIYSDQFNLVLGESFVLTFQESTDTIFDPIRERIRNNKGRIRSMANDYLAYVLMDAVIDQYIRSVETLGEQIEDLEQLILEHPDDSSLLTINRYKREISYFLKSVRPMNSIVAGLLKSEADLFERKTYPYLNDLADHSAHCSDALLTYREILSDYLSIYQTGVSNRMNEVMKILTMFSAIFIPLTFIAGVYGTNFRNVPEYGFKYAYFIMWGVMAVLAVVMFFYFRRKKWL